MKKFLISILIIIISQYTHGNNNLDSLLLELEQTMNKRAVFDNAKKLRIKNLEKLINEEEDRNTLQNNYFLINEIIKEYEKYSFDKALTYIEKNLSIARKLNNTDFEKESQLKLARLLVTSGRYKESIDVLHEINRNEIPENLLNLYYYNFKEGYSGLTFYTTVSKSKENYTYLYKKYQDSLQSRLTVNSDESLALTEKEFRDKRQIEKALKINSQRLSQAKSGTPKYSLITFERSLLYGLKKKQ